MEKIQIRDGKNSDPGSGINIPDSQHWTERARSTGLPSRQLQILKSFLKSVTQTNLVKK
jgi:hypothetical protein